MVDHAICLCFSFESAWGLCRSYLKPPILWRKVAYPLDDELWNSCRQIGRIYVLLDLVSRLLHLF